MHADQESEATSAETNHAKANDAAPPAAPRGRDVQETGSPEAPETPRYVVRWVHLAPYGAAGRSAVCEREISEMAADADGHVSTSFVGDWAVFRSVVYPARAPLPAPDEVSAALPVDAGARDFLRPGFVADRHDDATPAELLGRAALLYAEADAVSIRARLAFVMHLAGFAAGAIERLSGFFRGRRAT